jgi:2-dehydro-3-deoxy-L-rhamnonate dehydrogenase (NAD+)
MKTAFVTGASNDIGRAIAKRLARDGFVEAFANQDEASADATPREVDSTWLGGTFPVLLDVSDSVSFRRMTDAVLERHGAIDVLVDNAGVAGPSIPLQNYPDNQWCRPLTIDLDGATLLHGGIALNAAPAFQPNYQPRFYSRQGGRPHMVAYSAAKARVIGLKRHWVGLP